MLENYDLQVPQGTRAQINTMYRKNETELLANLIDQATLPPDKLIAIEAIALKFIEHIRQQRRKNTGIDSFLNEYSLSSDEGIALMCLAEALLRVPDSPTIDSLIKDKLAAADWKSHQGCSGSFFVNATTWALMLTGRILTPETADSKLTKVLLKLINRSSEGLVRKAADTAMRIMSKQFVMGRTIKEAISRAKAKETLGYRYSYDMLGEAAITGLDAECYFDAYLQAITSIGVSVSHCKNKQSVHSVPGISIKLSALHPRYQESQRSAVMRELPQKLLALARIARQYNIGLTVDAEESERLELSLDIIETVFNDQELRGWDGFGLAVQSYQKRADCVLDWVHELATRNQQRIIVRLIKGAYWDSEIKKTQMLGLADYPVFTRKVFTDVSFQACAKKLLTMTDMVYPQFATHNAYSVAMILNLAGEYRDFEFQCLHGMGTELYEQIVPKQAWNIPCRIYAPVGSHEDLLPYLVRRLLENGANSSFVNRIIDEAAPISSLVADPVIKAKIWLNKPNLNIPNPAVIFLPQRFNSAGFDLTDRAAIAALQQRYAITKRNMPETYQASLSDCEISLAQAALAFPIWSKISVDERAKMLEQFALLLEENRDQLWELLCCEAGKTWADSVAEVREAVDFCRYYAYMARQMMNNPLRLLGYTGEINELSWHPRGVALCISPWNFPLAIFVGQVVAALVTGNCVIAKPAEQTPLIAMLAIKLMHQAGIMQNALHLLPGKGEIIGAKLVADQRIKVVLFTGSTVTANIINQTLAARGGPIIPLIAETGGQNVMVVDSSALLEQVIIDVIGSAFGSAGQRCSALRVLYLQEEIYARGVELLKGAMAELIIGDPRWLHTDVGPVIDKEALDNLKNYVSKMQQSHEIIYQCQLSAECSTGYFMPPTAIAIDSIMLLEREIFGPVLHVIAYKRDSLEQIIAEINNTGYGLTLGIQSRITQTARTIFKHTHAGNYYVNRNMVGAVVGLQPFGGEGLSGTGPKAGGPHYLWRLCQERTYTVDTTAAGGNASLMSMEEPI